MSTPSVIHTLQFKLRISANSCRNSRDDFADTTGCVPRRWTPSRCDDGRKTWLEDPMLAEFPDEIAPVETGASSRNPSTIPATSFRTSRASGVCPGTLPSRDPRLVPGVGAVCALSSPSSRSTRTGSSCSTPSPSLIGERESSRRLSGSFWHYSALLGSAWLVANGFPKARPRPVSYAPSPVQDHSSLLPCSCGSRTSNPGGTTYGIAPPG